jgi:hypothetical protein
MRRALIPAVVLLLGSSILGATALREPVARAAAPIASVFVTNDASSPVPVREQNLDANGNVKVHEQGVANVDVNGVVTTEAAQPSNGFSLASLTAGAPSFDNLDGCDQSLPAGTRWFISSFAVSNGSTFEAVASLDLLLRQEDSFAGRVVSGPVIPVPAGETVQLTFPQPFVLTSPQNDVCLKGFTTGPVATTVVGHRR